jgi:rubredoxin
VNAWLCTRCGAVSTEDNGNQRDGSLPPTGWRQMYSPKGEVWRVGPICTDCVASLALWFKEGGSLK